MRLFDLLTVFSMALLGAGHCAGMCGGLAALASGTGSPRWLPRHAAYLLGKGVAYATVGTLLWMLGFWLRGILEIAPFRAGLAWFTGGILLFVGFGYATGWRWGAGGFWARHAGGACNALRGVWSSQSLAKSFLLGWLNGFLPCGLSLSAIVLLVRAGSLPGVWAGSLVFGLGTLPGLLLVTWGASRVSPQARARWVRLGGAFLMALGLFTLLRGQPGFLGWLHSLFGGVHLSVGDEPWCQP